MAGLTTRSQNLQQKQGKRSGRRKSLIIKRKRNNLLVQEIKKNLVKMKRMSHQRINKEQRHITKMMRKKKTRMMKMKKQWNRLIKIFVATSLSVKISIHLMLVKQIPKRSI